MNVSFLAAITALLADGSSVAGDTSLSGAGDEDAGGIGAWWVLWALLLVFLNAFFVLAEFAITKVRSSQVDEVAEERNGLARLAKRVLVNLNTYVSTSQLGIALSTLGLGMLLGQVWGVLPDQVQSTWIQGLILIVMLLGSAMVLLVFGELVPRSFAIRQALPATLAIVRPLTYFHQAVAPFVGVSNWISRRILRLLKIEPVSEAEIFHSADELIHLVSETERAQEVTDIERKIVVNALELNDRVVRDVMLPRADVIWLDRNKDFETNIKKAIESQHTRFPLVDGHLDHPQGLVHIKDLIKIRKVDHPDLDSIKRKLEHVPELMRLDALLEVFLTNRAHMALVVDEYGGAVGIVTLDNVLEELVGDIQDEFDLEEGGESDFQRVDDHSFLVEGTFALYELADRCDLDLEDPEVSTIGGYVTHQLGRLPDIGEEVPIEGYIATVLESDGRSIGRLRFKRTQEAIDTVLALQAEEASANGSVDAPEKQAEGLTEPKENLSR